MFGHIFELFLKHVCSFFTVFEPSDTFGRGLSLGALSAELAMDKLAAGLIQMVPSQAMNKPVT